MDPSFVSLQETHCQYGLTPIPPRNFTSYFVNFVNSSHDTTLKQGAGVLIKSNISYKLIPVNSEYQIIAVEIKLNIKFTIISFYIPPNQDISPKEISNIINSFNTPVLVFWDFNGWNIIWDKTTNNNRDIVLENIILFIIHFTRLTFFHC